MVAQEDSWASVLGGGTKNKLVRLPMSLIGA